MQQSLDAMKVAVRVLMAINERRDPDPDDIRVLRLFSGGEPVDLGHDELACAVIQKALQRRAALRARGMTG